MSDTHRYFKDKEIIGGTLSQMVAYSELFERLSDAIFLIDWDTKVILECNSASRKVLLRGASEKLVGKTLSELVDPAERSALDQLYQSVETLEHTSEPKDYHFNHGVTLEIIACSLKLGDYKRIIQVIGKDVTQIREAKRRLEELSTIDEMTQLYNRRSLNAELEKEMARSKRYETPFSVVFVDVDHFKNYNDKNGHPAGDEVLRKVAAIIKSQSRTTDFPCRYGGEEFVVLCPGVNWKGGKTLGEFLRAAVETEQFPHGEKQPMGRLTISVGVASVPDHGKTIEEVLQAADEALYESKKAGRNRVTVAGEN